MKQKLRVSLAFSQGSDAKLEERCAAVLVNLFGNPAFATPPVAKAALEAADTAFRDAMAAMEQGGTATTAHKNNMREALIKLLVELALYVQVTSDNDLAVLLSSGFQATSTNTTREPLAAPTILRLVPGETGQLVLKVTPIRNARSYEVDVAEIIGDETLGPWTRNSIFTNSRRMTVAGLMRAKTYAVRVRAIGGVTGQSGWSLPTSQLCN